jgi:hypothetical protein
MEGYEGAHVLHIVLFGGYALLWIKLLGLLEMGLRPFLLTRMVKQYQYSKTNVMYFLFNLLRTKGLYMFWALVVQLQEAPHKQRLVYCVRVMSVGCYQGWSGTPVPLQPWLVDVRLYYQSEHNSFNTLHWSIFYGMLRSLLWRNCYYIDAKIYSVMIMYNLHNIDGVVYVIIISM